MTETVTPLVTSPERDDVPMGDFIHVVAARKWTIMLIMVILTVAATASVYRKPTPYVSDASVLISTGAQTTVQAQQSMNTEKALAKSRAVAAVVADRLHLRASPESLLAGLSADVLLDTQVLDLTYSAAESGRAKRLAQGFADAYVAYRGELVDRVVASYGTLDARISELRDELSRAQSDAAGASDPAVAAAARERASGVSSELILLEQRRDGLFATAPVNAVVVERASEPKKTGRALTRTVVLALVAGFALGVAVAYALEARALRRRRMHGGVEGTVSDGVVWRR